MADVGEVRREVRHCWACFRYDWSNSKRSLRWRVATEMAASRTRSNSKVGVASHSDTRQSAVALPHLGDPPSARKLPISNHSPIETAGGVARQPSPKFAPELTTADVVVETLISWGATCCFGVVGTESTPSSKRCANARIRSSISACVTRKQRPSWRRASPNVPGTWRVVGTTGPARPPSERSVPRADGWSAGCRNYRHDIHDLIGTRYQQGVDTTKLMQDVALYNVEVTGPEHAIW